MTTRDPTKNFRRMAKQKIESAPARRGGQFPPWDYEQVAVVVGESFHVRFKEPPSGEAYRRAYHWPANQFPATCTLEHPAFGERCVDCVVAPDKTDRGRRTTRTLVELIDFRFSHIVPHSDPEKREKKKEMMETCSSASVNPKVNRCPHCASSDPRIAERHGPLAKFIELTTNQYEQVWGVHTELQGTCVQILPDGTVCNNNTYPIAFLCEQCEATVVDDDVIRTMPHAELGKLLQDPVTCPSCSHEGYLWGVYACEGDGRSPTPAEMHALGEMTLEERPQNPDDGTHWTVRGSMFDKMVKMTVSGQSTVIDDKTVTLKVYNFSTGAEWSTIEEDLAAYGVTGEDAEKLIAPMDFDERFRPMKSLKPDSYPTPEKWADACLAARAEDLKVKNMFATGETPSSGWASKGSGGIRSFGKPKQ